MKGRGNLKRRDDEGPSKRYSIRNSTRARKSCCREFVEISLKTKFIKTAGKAKKGRERG